MIVDDLVGERIKGHFVVAVLEGLDAAQVAGSVRIEMADFRHGEREVFVEGYFLVDAARGTDVVVQMSPVGLPGALEEIGCAVGAPYHFNFYEQYAVHFADFLEELEIGLERFEADSFARRLEHAVDVFHDGADQVIDRFTAPFHPVYLGLEGEPVGFDGFLQPFRQTLKVRMVHGNRQVHIRHFLVEPRDIQQLQRHVAAFHEEGPDLIPIRFLRQIGRLPATPVPDRLTPSQQRQAA